MDTIRKVGSGSVWSLSRASGLTPQQVGDALQVLVREHRVHMVDVNGVTRYFLPTQELLDCQCEGTCLQQVVALSSPYAQDVYRLIRNGRPVKVDELSVGPRLSEVEQQALLQNHIKRFLAVGLISEDDGEGRSNGRSRYRVKTLHPVVQSVFRFTG